MALASELYLKSMLPGRETELTAEELSGLLQYVLEAGLARIQPVQPRLNPGFTSLLGKPLPRIPKAVLVDIYGTLLATGLGEVGSTEEAIPSTLESASTNRSPAAGYKSPVAYTFPDDFIQHLHALIAEDHGKARAAGIPWPEVDAISVFMRVLGLEPPAAAKACVAWECLANPCAPMPGAADFLALCRQLGLGLGIVSNAQFYTPLFIQAAFGIDSLALGLEPGLSFWSYRTGRAKPDRFMYDQAAKALAKRNIPVADVLYVGNDALNDCAAAGEAGFMTALFAGDARSFRPREDSPRVMALPPDTVVSGWDMLAALVVSSTTNRTQRSTPCI
jgi:putative hydrolase of the HAD superfamily